MVVHLMEPYLNKGYHLFVVNWYNSVTQYRSKQKTYINGTLRPDIKFTQEVMTKKLKKKKIVSQSLDDISVTKSKKTF